VRLFLKNKEWEQKPKTYGLIALLILLISGFLASKIEFEEDISKLIPLNDDLEKFNSVYQNSKFFERLVFNISLKDTLSLPAPEELVSFANDFVDSLNSSSCRSHISNITYKVSDETMYDIYNYYFENIPYFLEEHDYWHIDSLLSRERINSILEKNYRLLVSPASMVLKNFILRDPLSIVPIVLKRLQKLQFGNNFELYNGAIVTKDKKHLLIFVSSIHRVNQTSENGILINGIDEVLRKTLLEHKLVSAEYFGGIAVSVGNSRIIKDDVILTVTASVVLLILFISLFIRVKWAFLITFLPAIFGAAISLAILYLIKTKISAIALGVGSIMLGFGVDYALYILSYFKGKKSISRLQELTAPILLCSITTAAVFFCLTFVKTEALHDLGLFITFSILGAAFFALVFLPHFINMKKRNTEETSSVNSKMIIWFSNYRFDKKPYLLFFILIATIVFIFTSRNVEFESDMKKMSYMSEKLSLAENNLKRISNVSLRNIYLISSGDSFQEALETNEAILKEIIKLKENNLIKDYTSISPILVSNSLQQIRLNRWTKFWQAGRKDSLIDYILTGSKKLNFTNDAFNDFFAQLNKDYKTIKIDNYPSIKRQFIDDWTSMDENSINLVTLLKTDSKLTNKIYKPFESNPNVFVGDMQHLTGKMIELLKEDFNLLINLSSVIVLIILIIVYGRIELGIVVFLPILVSWLWILGIMGLLGEKFTIFNIIISTLIFGTGVDYCILIARNALQDYRYGKKDLSNYKIGIFFSAFTTIIGVGVLFFANHPALRSIALLPIIGYCCVVLITFTLEIQLARWLLLSKKEKGTYPVTILTLFFTFIAYLYFISGCFLLATIGFALKLIPFSNRKKKDFFHIILRNFTKSQIYVMRNVKKEIINPNFENFKKPAVIICNHQSVLDILLMIMTHQKFLLLTNEWVWNSPFFGKIVKFADFYSITEGIDNSIPQLKEKVKEGYSIVIFPEGTRSETGKIKRFRKGAFYIAEKLSLDILPIIIHGTADCIKKGEFSVRSGKLTMKYLDRIPLTDVSFGNNYSERSKSICSFFRNEYEKLREEIETPEYYKDRLIKNFIYKGPILEWYIRTKLRLESNYNYINNLIPRKARITDIGCGYGYISYLLLFISEERHILGIDYDENKIKTAQNCFSKNNNINFECADVSKYSLDESDVFLLIDVLHYLPVDKQRKILVNCINNLAEGGLIIVKDADNSLHRKHKITKLTEFLSTNFGFNKVGDKNLSFVDHSFFNKLVDEFGLKLRVIRNSTLTSNRVLVISK